MNTTSPITTHVLDTSHGRPAAGISVKLEQLIDANSWRTLAEGKTNSDGRISDLLPAGTPIGGRFRLIFSVADYFAALNLESFYPQVTVEFHVAASAEHHHVPLLLSPFGYSTYRGS